MRNPFLFILEIIDNFLKRNEKLTNLVVLFFDFASKITHFFLFNFKGYFSLILVLFFVPIYYTEQFMEFLMLVVREPLQFISCFTTLPLVLSIVFIFLLLLIELVILCTFLSLIPTIKEKMIDKYKDPLIIKKRGYNMNTSSFARVATLGLPAAAAIVVAGDVSEHSITVNAIIKAN